MKVTDLYSYNLPQGKQIPRFVRNHHWDLEPIVLTLID